MSTIIHAVAGYWFLLLIVRLLSRRPGGSLTIYEYTFLFLIGGVAILATVGRDRSVTNCATAIIAIGMMHWTVSWLKTHFPRFGVAIDGTPLVLLEDGVWRKDIMDGVRISSEDVMAAARSKGVGSIFDVKYAILERTGAISIITREEGRGD
jgi:uncharacterized membrane protein YcaP (DUF421 family)